MDKIKIIFLDIDGVLRPVTGEGFDKKCINNLNKLTEETGAKLVISSTWRRRGLDEVKKFLQDKNVKGDIIDITPIFNIKKVWPILTDSSEVKSPRGLEIKEWLKDYTTMDRYIESYVIIDDSEDMLLSQLDNYVKVEQTIGFNSRCLNKAIRILNILGVPTI